MRRIPPRNEDKILEMRDKTQTYNVWSSVISYLQYFDYEIQVFKVPLNKLVSSLEQFNLINNSSAEIRKCALLIAQALYRGYQTRSKTKLNIRDYTGATTPRLRNGKDTISWNQGYLNLVKIRNPCEFLKTNPVN